MRWLDRWLGLPVCLLLTLWQKAFGRCGRGRSAPRRILFVKLAEQGSTVLAQGAIAAAVRRVGRDNVYFLLFAENRPVLDVLGLIPRANVIEIKAGSALQTFWAAAAAVWTMRRLGLDVAIDLEFFARSSAALCYLSGAGRRVGYHAFGGAASYRGDLMTHRVAFNPYLHTSQAFQILVEALDHDPAELPRYDRRPPAAQPSPARFRPAPEEVAPVRRLVEGCLPEDRDYRLILLNANSSDLVPLRKWPGERYVELAAKLLAHYPDVAVAFTGGRGEQAAAEELVRRVRSERCFSVAGKTSLRQLLVLFGLAEVLVTNDSGPAHFATLTPIDVVVLFGPETPRLFAARSRRTHPLWAGLACSPCINAFNNRNSLCTNNSCMQAITVDRVFAEVCGCYERRRRRAQRGGISVHGGRRRRGKRALAGDKGGQDACPETQPVGSQLPSCSWPPPW